MKPEEQTKKYCLNCGELLIGDYCHRCGQKATVSRLRPGEFAKDTLAGLLRVNRGFVFTARMLLLRPWRVVADFVSCRRAAYTQPVQMLLIVSFLLACVAAIFTAGNESDTPASISLFPTDTIWGGRLNDAVQWWFDTLWVQYLTLMLPVLAAARLAYRQYGAGRYNTAEYMVAAMYFISALLLFRIITQPLRAHTSVIPGDDIAAILNFGYGLLLGCIFVTKTFRVQGRGMKAKRMAVFFILIISLYIMLAMILGVTAVILTGGE